MCGDLIRTAVPGVQEVTRTTRGRHGCARRPGAQARRRSSEVRLLGALRQQRMRLPLGTRQRPAARAAVPRHSRPRHRRLRRRRLRRSRLRRSRPRHSRPRHSRLRHSRLPHSSLLRSSLGTDGRTLAAALRSRSPTPTKWTKSLTRAPRSASVAAQVKSAAAGRPGSGWDRHISHRARRIRTGHRYLPSHHLWRSGHFPRQSQHQTRHNSHKRLKGQLSPTRNRCCRAPNRMPSRASRAVLAADEFPGTPVRAPRTTSFHLPLGRGLRCRRPQHTRCHETQRLRSHNRRSSRHHRLPRHQWHSHQWHSHQWHSHQWHSHRWRSRPWRRRRRRRPRRPSQLRRHSLRCPGLRCPGLRRPGLRQHRRRLRRPGRHGRPQSPRRRLSRLGLHVPR